MVFAFAGFELDASRHALLRDGVPVPVEPMVFDLLHLLVRRPGELVTRDEMVAALWQGRIVSDAAISACIAAARRAVDDDGQRQAVIRTVPRRGIRLVADVSEIDRAPAPAPQAAPAPAPPRIRYAMSDRGQRIAYTIHGDGPPVIRIGTTFFDLVEEWRIPSEQRYLERLGQHLRLLRFDHIGSGQSDRHVDRYDLAEDARTVRALADAAGFDRFAIYAESGACGISALHFANLYPERLTRLAIVGGFVDGRNRRAAAPKEDTIRRLIADGWASPDSGFAMAMMAVYFPEGPFETVRALVKMAQTAISPENALRNRDIVNGASAEPLMPNVRCPTLVLHSRHDAVHPLSEAQRLAAGIAGAELVVLETANHIPLYGTPAWDEFMTVLVDFLAG